MPTPRQPNPDRRRPDPDRRRLLARTVPVQIAAAAAVADGSAPADRRFELVAYTGEPMRLDWWDLPVVIDLAATDLSEQRVPVLYDHCRWDPCYIVGQADGLAVENGQIIARGRFVLVDDQPPERDYARQVLSRADAGYQWQASVGADPQSVEKIEAGASVTVNGRTYQGPLYVAKGITVREVSFVILGGDRRTSALVARHRRNHPPHLKGAAAMTFQEWLVGNGFEKEEDLTETQRVNMMRLFLLEFPEGDETAGNTDTGTGTETPANAANGGTDEDPPPANAAGRRPAVQARRRDPVADLRASAAAEMQRQEEIRAICAAATVSTMTVGNRTGVSIAAHAVEQGWTPAETRREIELQELRAARGQGPAVIVAEQTRTTALEALAGALILRARGRLDHPAYAQAATRLGPIEAAERLPAWLRAPLDDPGRNRIMEAAHGYAEFSLVDLCREVVRLQGGLPTAKRGTVIQAAFSGGNLANVFTTSVNAILLAKYMEQADTSQLWTTETDVMDYKTNERPRVEIGDGLALLPRGGTAEDAKFADLVESYAIHRYARRFSVDEIDVINDNLSALVQIPTDFGKSAGRLRPDLVYSIILANGTLNSTSRALFNATDGNLDTTAALAAATLKAAISAMMLFSENGVTLNLTPTHLIVPPSLIHTARELLNSQGIITALAGTTDASTERGSANVLQGLAIPVAEGRLENGVTDPKTRTAHTGSSSTWYLASTQAHTIEVAYLSGTGRSPRVRSYNLDRGQYGMGWDVELSIGAKALDWRGLHKATA